MNALLAQTRIEMLLSLRRFESILITVIVPVVLLIFFATIGVAPDEYDDPVDFLLPGMLALAVMSTGLVGLSIRTAYERSYGVLKRLGTTPLTRQQLILAKVISVVRDVSDAYLHAGGQYEWDSAAPVAVARAAGLHTSRVDGSELCYNRDDVLLPDLVVCRPELAEPILAFIRDHGTE